MLCSVCTVDSNAGGELDVWTRGGGIKVRFSFSVRVMVRVRVRVRVRVSVRVVFSDKIGRVRVDPDWTRLLDGTV